MPRPGTYAAVIRTAAEELRQPVKRVRRTVEHFLAVLRDEAWIHGRIVVPQFAVIRVRPRKARVIQNPINRQPMNLRKCRAIRLRATKNWRTQ